MIGVSGDFQALVKTSHTSICLVEIIQNGQVVLVLDVHDGSVEADRTAGQMRRFVCTAADASGTLTPVDITGLLAPFGTRCIIYRGVRITNIILLDDVVDRLERWWAGADLVGVVVDPVTGELRLGWDGTAVLPSASLYPSPQVFPSV